MTTSSLSRSSTSTEIDRFLAKAAKTPVVSSPRGRLIFALDATASRQPTWDQACQLQGDMFAVAGEIGGLALQLVWYRGYDEFQVEPWLVDAAQLRRRMTAVQCHSGLTQIRRVLHHAVVESQKDRINALVVVGDCLEEAIEPICSQAGQLSLRGVPAFMFQEGTDPVAAQGFKAIARLTRGAYCAFDAGSAQQLRSLLQAVAVYAAGGRPALALFAKQQGGLIPRLAQQL